MDRRWSRLVGKATSQLRSPRAAALVLLVAAAGVVGMYARGQLVAGPQVVVQAFAFDGPDTARKLAADVRVRLVARLQATTTLEVRRTGAPMPDSYRVSGRLTEQDGVLTLELRVEEASTGRELATARLTEDWRRLETLVDRAAEAVTRSLPPR